MDDAFRQPRSMQKNSSAVSIALCTFCCAILFQGALTSTIFPDNVFFKYEALSQQYLQHDLDQERLLDVSPLYFALHVAARRYFPNPQMFFRAFHVLVGGVSAMFLVLLLRRFFAPPVAIATPVAIIGVAAFITSRSVIVYTSIFEPEAVMICLVLGFLYFVMSPKRAVVGLAGVCLGLSILTRSNFLPVAMLAPIYFWLRTEKKRAFCMLTLCFEIPILLAIGVLTVRNTMLTGTLTLFAMNPGYVFFEGNNPNSLGESAIYPPLVDDLVSDFDRQQPDFQHVAYRTVARRLASESLSIADVNAFWAQKARNFMIDHPFHTLKRLALKSQFFLRSYRRHDLALAYQYDQLLQQAHIPTIPYAFIAGLALIGMAQALPQWQRYFLLYGVLLTQFGVMLVTYVSDRQRVVLTGVMLLFACQGVLALTRKKSFAMLGVPGVIVLTLVLSLPNDVIQDDEHTWARYAASNRALMAARQARQAGKLAEAAHYNASALAFTPALAEHLRLATLSFLPGTIAEQAVRIAGAFSDHSFSAQFDQACLLLQAGQLDDAERLFTQLREGRYRLNRQFYQSSQLDFYLARIAELRGHPDQAVAHLQLALRANPGDPWVLAHLSVLTHEPRYGVSLFRYFDALDGEFFLGQAAFETGQYQEARTYLSSVVQRLPEYRRGRIYLSLALAQSGEYEQAVRHYLAAIEHKRDPVFAEQLTIQMFREWARQSPKNAEAPYYLSVILQEFGHYHEAYALQHALLSQENSSELPYADNLKTRLQWLEKALEQNL